MAKVIVIDNAIGDGNTAVSYIEGKVTKYVVVRDADIVSTGTTGNVHTVDDATLVKAIPYGDDLGLAIPHPDLRPAFREALNLGGIFFNQEAADNPQAVTAAYNRVYGSSIAEVIKRLRDGVAATPVVSEASKETPAPVTPPASQSSATATDLAVESLAAKKGADKKDK